MWKTNYFLLLLLIGLFSCGEDDTAYPRPKGYFRIDFPEKKYVVENAPNLPFNFERPFYSNLQGTKIDSNQLVTNLQFGWYNATLYCFYIEDTNLVAHVDFAKDMAYKHKDVARSIEAFPYRNDSTKVYGLLYEIKGEKVASNYSFYLMDSVNRYFRGSFYFNQSPNSDSLQPVLDYLKLDLDRMMSTFEWVNP